MNYNNKAMLVGAMLVAGYDAKNGGQVRHTRDTDTAAGEGFGSHCPGRCAPDVLAVNAGHGTSGAQFGWLEQCWQSSSARS
jgi:hypothetical protein